MEKFEVRVEWENGDVTKENVISETDHEYYFEYARHHSYYAPKKMCTKIN